MNKTVAALIGLVVGAGAGVGSAWMLQASEVERWRSEFNGAMESADKHIDNWAAEKLRADKCTAGLAAEAARARDLEDALMAAKVPEQVTKPCCLDAAKLEQQRDEARSMAVKESGRRLDAESSFRECELNLLVLKSK